MKLEINLEDITVEHDSETGEPLGTVEQAVVDAAARMIADRITNVSRTSLDAFRNRIEEIVLDEASKQAESLVAEVLSGPIQRTTGWGEKRGEATTAKALVEDAMNRWMELPKNDGWSQGNMASVLEKLVNKHLERDFKAHIENVKKSVTLEVQKRAVDAAVKELLK